MLGTEFRDFVVAFAGAWGDQCGEDGLHLPEEGVLHGAGVREMVMAKPLFAERHVLSQTLC